VTDAKTTDMRIPPYLGRVLSTAGVAAGTCFQVTPGVLVTAWHVLDDVRAAQPGDEVMVDPLGGGNKRLARVERVDDRCDLAVLIVAEPLEGCVVAVSHTDRTRILTDIAITGVAHVEDPDHDYGFLDTSGQWQGGTTKDEDVLLGRLSSKSVVKGMSGAPVRRLVDDVVVGVVSARYTSTGWLRDSVWIARVEDLLPLLAGVAELVVTGQPRDRTVGRSTVIAAVSAVVVLAIMAGVGIQSLLTSDVNDPSSLVPAKSSDRQMPPGAAPVAIESVTGMQRRRGDPKVVLPDRLDLTPQEFAEFEEVSASGGAASWFDVHGEVPVGFGSTKISVRGNAAEPVRIVDIKIRKNCQPPLDGTYFQSYTQGSPTDNVMLGIDLDATETTVQELALTSGQGLIPVGEDYFSLKSIELAPGEKQDLLIGALTKKQSCSFSLQLVIATSSGQFTQDVDDNGKPFEVTAPAPAKAAGFGLSGYGAAYLGTSTGWIRVDPATYQLEK
jgi:trypsin-like peptidase